MKIDKSIVRRGLTIAIGAPIVLLLIQNPVTLTFLVYIANYISMIEWTAMKRHLKVALLDPDDASPFATKQLEFKTPVAKTNLFIICKVLAGSLICPLTWFGPSYFHLGMTTYYFFWVLFTLMGQNKAESKVSTFFKKLVDPRTPTSRSQTEQFQLHEMDIISRRYTTDLMLSFALEYFGFVWTAGLCYILLLYHVHPIRGPAFATALTVGNWVNDIFALIVGRTLKGRTHALYPRISPNKSVEGAIAGVLSNGIAVGLLMWGYSIYYNLDWPVDSHFLLFSIVGILMGVLGVIGDLLESLLKRTARIKDTGSLLPGHGGILDRVDGMLLVFPIGYWVLWAVLQWDHVRYW